MPYAYGVDNKIILDKRVYSELKTININTIDKTSYSADSYFTMINGFHREYYINEKLYDSWRMYHRRANERPAMLYRFRDFFYCGRVYLLAQPTHHTTGETYIPEDVYYFVTNKADGEPFSIPANPSIMKYAKDNNIPFFMYRMKSYVDSTIDIIPISKYIPLHKIKLPILADANQVYNDIYNQNSSYLNDDECIEVSNEDKIKQAGFDLKTSFRKM